MKKVFVILLISILFFSCLTIFATKTYSTSGQGVSLLANASLDSTHLPAPLAGTSAIWTGSVAYIFGGGNSGGATNTIIKFDPSSDTITTMSAKLPDRVTDPFAVFDGRYAYLLSGWSQTTQTNFGKIVRYDTQTNSVTVMSTTLPTWDMIVAWDGHYAYLFGGWNGYSYYNQILRYDPSNDKLTTMTAHLPYAMKWGSAVYANSYVYIFGGNKDYNAPFNQILKYDPVADSVSIMSATLPGNLYFSSAIWTGSYAYIFGGATNTVPTDTNIIAKYDPSNDQCTATTDQLPSAREETSAVWTGQYAYIFGGNEGTSGTLDEIVKYSPSTTTTVSHALVGYWKFDEGSGTTSFDSSGNGNTGTLGGPKWVAGVSGSALSFNGVNNYVSVPSSSSLAVQGNAISLEAWIKPSITLDNGFSHIVSVVDKGDEYTFQINPNDGRIWFAVVLQPGVNWQGIATTTASWGAGTWYHLVGTYDGSTLRVFVNGVLQNSKLLSGNLHSPTSFPFTIGAHSSGYDLNFNGIIDEVKIYDYARTFQQIANDYALYTQANQNPNFQVGNMQIINNLAGFSDIKSFMRYAGFDSRYVDVDISVNITPSSNIQAVQLKTGGTTNPDTFILSKETGDTFSCHLVIPDPNQFIAIFLNALTIKVPGQVDTSTFPQIELVQPKITSIVVTDSNGNTFTKDLNQNIPTFEELLPNWTMDSSTGLLVMCPVDLLVTDSQNRSIGAIYENGVFSRNVSQIPGAYFFGSYNSDSSKLFYLPYKIDSYSVTGYAFGNGKFNITAIASTDADSTPIISSQSGSVVRGNVLNYSLGITSNTNLALSGNVLAGPTTTSSPSPKSVTIVLPVEAFYAIIVAVIIVLIVIAIAAITRRTEKGN